MECKGYEGYFVVSFVIKLSHNKFWSFSVSSRQEDTTGVWLQLWCVCGDHLGNGNGDCFRLVSGN